MHLKIVPLLSLIAAHVAFAQANTVSGIAFNDANGNGIRDRSENGLAGVVVSNQDVVVTTGAGGAFRIARGQGIVFVSVPDGYRSIGRFWQPVTDATTMLEFPLKPSATGRDVTFVHASDTHIAPVSVERIRRLRVLVDSLRPTLALITGDLVRDALRVSEAEATSYYDLFTRETALFKTPLWVVPGNHENFGIERSQSHVSESHPLYGRGMYHRYFGPDYYSFTRGGVHFVGLNTVDIDDQWYYGHVDSLQLAWLERDLALVPKNMPVVTFDGQRTRYNQSSAIVAPSDVAGMRFRSGITLYRVRRGEIDEGQFIPLGIVEGHD